MLTKKNKRMVRKMKKYIKTFPLTEKEIDQMIAEIPGISFLNRMGGAGLGVVRAVLWIWIFFAVVYCFQATHWGNVCMKQIQGDMALAWIRENNPVLMLLKKY